MGAWIEIINSYKQIASPTVAPLVGAWIEMIRLSIKESTACVAPLVGAWIEMYINVCVINRTKSLPSWERGLKYILALSK